MPTTDTSRHSHDEHPEWCSPVLCYRTEEGVRVHMQAAACWEQDDLTRMQFRTGLLDPEDDPFTYLKLEMRSFLGGVHAILPLGDARRLRDQLSAHLDAAESGRSNRVEGVDGQLLTTPGAGSR